MKTVLIVDDERNMRIFIKRLLLKIGEFKILEAINGDQALDIVQKFHLSENIELIISDWNMPNLTGLDLLRKIRSDPSTRNMKFIMVTGYATKHDVLAAVEEKVTHYIVKPFNSQDFENIINKLLLV
jgi:two-component system chemotaxis response regulator CheY